MNHFAAINPRIEPLLNHRAGSIDFDRSLFEDGIIAHDEFYNDFLAAHDLRYFMSGMVMNTANSYGMFAIQRSDAQGHIEDAEVTLMKRLLPHVQQALDVRLRLARAGRQNHAYMDGLSNLEEATLLVDSLGRVLFTSPLADALLSRNDGVSSTLHMLRFSDARAADRYAAAVGKLRQQEGAKTDLSNRSFAARRPSGERSYIVSVRAVPVADDFVEAMLGAVAIVFIRDPETYPLLDKDLLIESYALTPAEADLAALLDTGASPADIADARGVSITTVRTQLYALMAKLGVNRQADVARLLRHYRRDH